MTHVVYFLLVGRLYRNADLSAAYPIMRGAAPLMTAIGAWLYLGEGLGLAGSGGVALLIGGVFWMAVEGVRRGGVDRAALIAALTNSAVIALYSLIDGAGARLSDMPSPIMPGRMRSPRSCSRLSSCGAWPCFRLRRHSPMAARTGRRRPAFFAYAIVVWAMTQAPIGLVAALRETSVIFAAAIGALVLHEKFKAPRYAAAAFIAAGIIVLRLG